jgi:hypothetical protein
MTDSKTPIGKGLSSMHRTTSRLLSFEKFTPVSNEEFGKQVKRLTDQPDDRTYDDTLKNSYSILRSRYLSLVNEENLIARMEKRAHLRNMLFRVLTTLLIGFSVMLVYWVASCFGIAMPLKGLS